MYELLSKELTTLTPRLAERFLTYNTFEDQRPLNPRHVSTLANCIREDLFTTGEIALVDYENGNGKNTYLVNGQHQCSGVLVAGKNIDAVLERYRCESMEDVSLLYRQFDNNKPKGLSVLVKMEATALGVEWPKKISQLIVSAATIKEHARVMARNNKVELLRRYISPGHLINRILTISTGNWQKINKHLLRSPVVCAMMLTYDKSQKDTEIFWSEVRDGEGLKRTMPSFQLREFLKETNYDRGNSAQGNGKRIATEHEMISRSITAWNAFRMRESRVNLKYYPGKPIPKAK